MKIVFLTGTFSMGRGGVGCGGTHDDTTLQSSEDGGKDNQSVRAQQMASNFFVNTDLTVS